MSEAPKAPPTVSVSIDAHEVGQDYATMNGWLGDSPPPGTVIDAIPPTDMRSTHRGRIRGRSLERMHAKANSRRDSSLEQQRSGKRQTTLLAAERWPDLNLGLLPRLRSIFVKPANPHRAVFDLKGNAYPADGLLVPAGDVYVQRRLRDGSLMRADPP